MGKTAAERKAAQRARRAGFCPACTVTCLRCLHRCLDASGKFVPEHDCAKAGTQPEKATCPPCLEARVDARKRDTPTA
jgi:hypothetical protein